MSISTLHTLGSIVVGGSSEFNIDGIMNSIINPGVQSVIERGAGEFDPSYVATMSQAPTFSFDCSDIATVLAATGLVGMAIPTSTTYTTVDAFLTQMAERATRTAGSNHFRVRVNEGMLIPKSLSWSQGQAAKLSCEIHATYDGSNAPLVYSDSVALPHTPTVDELFTGGKVTINGSVLYGVQSLTLDFGLSVIKESAGGDLWPTFVGIAERGPTITIQTKTAPSLTTYGLSGTAQGSSETSFYLTKVSKMGTRVAAGTAEHIKVSLSASLGQIIVDSAGGANNASADCTIRIVPIKSSGSAILTLNTATAIS